MTEQAQKFGAIVAYAWENETFRQVLLSDPAGVLLAAGVKMPDGLDVAALVNSGIGVTNPQDC